MIECTVCEAEIPETKVIICPGCDSEVGPCCMTVEGLCATCTDEESGDDDEDDDDLDDDELDDDLDEDDDEDDDLFGDEDDDDEDIG